MSKGKDPPNPAPKAGGKRWDRDAKMLKSRRKFDISFDALQLSLNQQMQQMKDTSERYASMGEEPKASVEDEYKILSSKQKALELVIQGDENGIKEYVASFKDGPSVNATGDMEVGKLPRWPQSSLFPK